MCHISRWHQLLASLRKNSFLTLMTSSSKLRPLFNNVYFCSYLCQPEWIRFFYSSVASIFFQPPTVKYSFPQPFLKPLFENLSHHENFNSPCFVLLSWEGNLRNILNFRSPYACLWNIKWEINQNKFHFIDVKFKYQQLSKKQCRELTHQTILALVKTLFKLYTRHMW